MPILRTVSLMLLTAVLFSPEAWGRDCTREAAIAAESVPYYIESWHKMREAFDHFGYCEDGSIAEAFSDAIVRLFASHWERLPEFASESRNAPAFKAFVLRHIDATAAAKDLNHVQFLATRKCPIGSSALCGQIEEATKRAGREQ